MKNLSQLNLENYRGGVFDWDGTLADTLGMWNETDQVLIQELAGQEVPQATLYAERMDFLATVGPGDTYLQYYEYLRQRYGMNDQPAEIGQKRLAIAQSAMRAMTFRSGAGEFLQMARDQIWPGKIALATVTGWDSIAYYRQSPALQAAGFPSIFDLVIAKEDVQHIKPHPEIYHKVLAAWGDALAADYLVFEDSLHGVQAAKAAGLTVVNIVDPYSAADQPEIDKLADFRAESWAELLENWAK
jgi:beta-phosphoglucomutase-like phosphatase (HAD superfamily)